MTTTTEPGWAQLIYGITGVGEKHAVVEVDDRVAGLIENGYAVPVELVYDDTPPTANDQETAEGEVLPPTPESETQHALDAAAEREAEGDYDAKTVEELREVIRGRNEHRDDDAHIPARGKKADLVAALQADDEALAQLVTAPYSDVGVWLAQQALTAVQAAATAAVLDPFTQVEVTHGTGVPLQDVCDGVSLLWARVVTVYPSNGDGLPFTTSRPSFDWPAWVVPVEVGILQCRTNIEEAGFAPDDEYETKVAQRDGDYRMVLLDGIAHYLPDLIRDCALGMRLEPWSPIGPQGGVSGGLAVVNVIVTQLDVAA